MLYGGSVYTLRRQYIRTAIRRNEAGSWRSYLKGISAATFIFPGDPRILQKRLAKERVLDIGDLPQDAGASFESIFESGLYDDVVEVIESRFPDRASRAESVEKLLFAHGMGIVRLSDKRISALEFLGRKYISDSARDDPKASGYDPFEYIGRALEENPGSFGRLVELAEGYKVEEMGHWKRLLEGGKGRVNGSS